MTSDQVGLDIAIVGGSLGGLFAAIPLLRAPEKHRVTIYERSGTPLLHDQGAGIVAAANVQRWLEKFNVWDMEASVPSKSRQYFDRAGNLIGTEALSQKMTSWDTIYHLGRANFDGLRSGHTAATWDEVTSGPKGDLLRDGWSRANYGYGRSVEELKLVDVAGKTKVEVRWKDTHEGSATKGQESTALADFVVCADGASSAMRRRLLDQETAERKYVGYVAFRGTVPEPDLEPSTLETFREHFSFFHAQGTQILTYLIPGINGAVSPGERLVNWVWYWNLPAESEELKEVLTDRDGNRHRYTLPTGGKIRPDVWQRQTQRAMELLPSQFAEVVNKTKKPFVQAITDVEPPRMRTKVGRLMDGKAALLGDALAGFRPHTAASTSQAAFDALKLADVFAGDISWEDYENSVLQFATVWQQRGVMLGTASQFQDLSDTVKSDRKESLKSVEEQVLSMMARDVEFDAVG